MKRNIDSISQAHLIERAGYLKGDLVRFGQSSRYAHDRKVAMKKHFDDAPPPDQYSLIRFLDTFLLEYRLPDSHFVVDHFVAEHPELSAAECEMLLGWKDVVEGLFEIDRIEKGALVAVNLIDDMTYLIRSNMGARFVRQFPPTSFVMTRIVPVREEWIFSGAQQTWPASQRSEIYRSARETALHAPKLVFRNPEKLEQARKMQAEDHREFVAFFGSDLVVLLVGEFVERMKAFFHYKVYEVRDEQGFTRDERAKREDITPPPLPEIELPEWAEEATSIGIIYDEVAGQYFWPDFGLIEEAFSDPDLARRHPYRDIVLSYLRDPDVPDLPLRRLAERDPAKADRLFQILLKRSRFSWERDGEALLRRYKSDLMDHPPLPTVIPLSERLTRGRSDESH